MKFLIILMCLIDCTVMVNGQGVGKYSAADQVALEVPDVESNTTDDISAFIKKHLNTDGEIVRSIYTWVIRNIKYDRDSIHLVILDEDNEQRITYALRRKKGVCENFAAIFNDLCKKAGISSFVIEGYTKQSGRIDRAPHVWCAAFTDGKWFLYDPTWDAGVITNNHFVSKIQTNFFKISPVDFISTHLPFDPLFQFLDYPVNYKEFHKGSLASADSRTYFNYLDSIRVYEDSDSLRRYLSSIRRIGSYGWPFPLIDIKLKRIKLEIELIYQDRDMGFYNLAVATSNEALAIFNELLIYRNNRFLPVKKEDEVETMFISIKKKIISAHQRLEEVNKSKAILALDTEDIKKRLNNLTYKVKEQQDFFKSYLSPLQQK